MVNISTFVDNRLTLLPFNNYLYHFSNSGVEWSLYLSGSSKKSF